MSNHFMPSPFSLSFCTPTKITQEKKMMNKVSIFIAIVLASTTIVTMAQEANGPPFKWPFLNNPFLNNPLLKNPFLKKQYDSTTLIKKFQCGATIHNVYSCIRLSFININSQKNHLLHSAPDCCTTITAFRERCGDFGVAKLESFIFPPMITSKCSVIDPPAPELAPAPAAGPDADVEIQM